MSLYPRNMFTQTIGFKKNLDDYTKEYLPKSIGQYFTTSPDILGNMLNDYHPRVPKTILEPSCGIGHLINLVSPEEHYKIDAYDIDKDVVMISKELFPDVKYEVCDFLKERIDKKYDLILANPPYYEIKKDEVPREFQEYAYGRTNIYYLFMYKCIQCLSDGGEMRIIVPKSFMSNRYAQKLREYVVAHCEIIDICVFDNSGLFKNAKQSVIILKCRKVAKPNTCKHVLRIGGIIVFVKDTSSISLVSGQTIKSLGCSVKTGSVDWVKHSGNGSLVSDYSDGGCIKIYYATDLRDTGCRPRDQKSKKPYLKKNDETQKHIVSTPCLLVQRIFSKRIVFKLIEEGEFCVENHVNVVSGPLEVLMVIKKSFENPRTSEFVKNVFSNRHLSQYELENVLQIYTDYEVMLM